LGSTSSAEGPASGSCEYGKKRLGSITCGVFFRLFDQLLTSQGRAYGISELPLKVTLHQLVVIFMVKMKCGTEGQWARGGGVFINVVVNCQDYTASVVELNTIIHH
jgi:hypothetical protein